MKKNHWIYLLIISLGICVILFKITYNNTTKTIEYSTAFVEINNLLNTGKSKFNVVSFQNSEDPIYLKTNSGVIEFQKCSMIKDINNTNRIQINYKSEDNFISILKLNNSKDIFNKINFKQFDYDDEQGYYTDELKNPIILLNYDNIKILYCDNLKNSSGRNYFYYDTDNINEKSVNVNGTRANEIYFWYNNCFYYIGIDINLEVTELFELVQSIIEIK